jgi:hypothetical protein
MKKIIAILFFIPFISQAQLWGFFPPDVSLNVLSTTASSNISFLYSFRKARTSYSGFCFRARRTDNNAQVDVDFDTTNITSNSSSCTVSAIGTSSYTIGQQMSWSTFVSGAPQVRVSIWYDQSGNGRNAIQNTVAAQPQIMGTQNGLFYLKYTGVENLYCPYASNVLLSANGSVQGVNGTLFIVATPSVGVNPGSFGYLSGSNVRWAAHLNWSDGNVYFDAGEVCCAGVRAFANSANNGLWKQYTMQRFNTNKLVRVSSVQKLNGIGNADSYDATNTSFGIGNNNQGTSSGHNGFIGEVILLKNALSQAELQDVENNQIQIWNAY